MAPGIKDPQLIKQVSDDIGKLGVVGELGNRLLVYLVGTSVQLNRPLSAM